MLAAIMILGASICAIVASAKNRNVVGWLFAGALFPVIALLILACQPALDPAVVGEPQAKLPTSRSV